MSDGFHLLISILTPSFDLTLVKAELIRLTVASPRWKVYLPVLPNTPNNLLAPVTDDLIQSSGRSFSMLLTFPSIENNPEYFWTVDGFISSLVIDFPFPKATAA